MISKLDAMIWEYQSKWGFEPKAIIVTPEQMLEIQKGFGLETTITFPNSGTIRYRGIKVMLKEEIIEL